ncbi:hypothetical protein B0H14DRAFT_3438894 [Mycena olivaceomarginata]|nr:hypothetical protein B0H14DRAFT_3438894 [Mycena olivaceomarginata]
MRPAFQFYRATPCFLDRNIPTYITASKKKSGKEAKTEGLAPFWAQLFVVYWTRFPWDLPFDQDPDPDTVPPPPPKTVEEEVLTAQKRELTPEEEVAKAKIQKDMKGKIKRWFSHKRSTAIGIHGNPYFVFLGRFRANEEADPPKRTTDFRFYMRHPEFRDAVMEAFTEKYSDQPKKMHVSLHCEVAKAMLAAESQEVKDHIKVECDAAHAEDVERYNESGDLEPDPDPATQPECCEKFISIVQPLLAGLQAYTGLTLNIIGGRINEETQKFETMSANSGVVNGKDWARWDPEGYAATLKTYLRFVHAGFLEKQHLVDGGAPPPPAAPIASPAAPAAPPAAPVRPVAPTPLTQA